MFHCTRRTNCVPPSRCTLSVFELTTEADPDVSSESPLIPTTPLLAGLRGLTVDPAAAAGSDGNPAAPPGGYPLGLG